MANKFKIKQSFGVYGLYHLKRSPILLGFLLVVILFSSLYPLIHTLIARAAPYVYEQTDQISNPVDMDEPIEFAVDSAGNYYTASVNTDYYIRKFSPAGVELMRFGTTDWSSTTGELGWPYGIAIKSNGEIYVSDGDNYRINIYSTTGQFVREITTFGVSQTFAFNMAIHFADNGNLYVLDDFDTIHVFDSSDNYIESYSNPGSGDGQFTSAYDFAVDTNGDIYIGDYINSRIQVLDSSWTYLRQFNTGALYHPDELALTQDGHVLVHDRATDVTRGIKKYTTAGVYVQDIGITDDTSLGGIGTANGEIYNFEDFVVLPSGNVATLESYPSRIQTFTSTGTYISQFGNAGSEPGQIGNEIRDVDIDASGNVYIADIENSRVQKYDADGNFLMEFGDQTTFIGLPYSLAVSPVNGDIYVFDGVTGVCTSRILIFNSAGTQTGTLGSCGTGAGQFANLGVSLAINAAGDVFIDTALSNDGKIMVYNSAGVFQREWLTTPDSSGFKYDQGYIALDSASNVYLTFDHASYIIKYDQFGNLITVFGKFSDATSDGYLTGARGIDVAPNGMIYIAEMENATVSVFDSNGNFMRRIGSWGYGNNQFKYPMDVKLGPNGKLYVADDENNRISIYDTSITPDPASVPLNLSATSASSGSLDVSWSTPASDGGDPIYGYLIEYQLPGVYDEWETYSQVADTQLSVAMTGLPAGDYNVRVKAINRAGHSVAATTASPVTVQAPLQLSGTMIPASPVHDWLADIGVYSDGSGTALSRYYYPTNRIQIGADGVQTSRLGSYGTGNDQLAYPRGAQADSTDALYVADAGNRRIVKYDQAGTYLAQYSTSTRYPIDIAIDETDSFFYVITSTSVSGTTGRVEKYTIDGTFVSVVTPAVTSATAITVATDGTLYIAHRTGLLREVAHYAADGTTLLGTYGQSGVGSDGLSSPIGVGVLSTGEVIVSDNTLDVVKVFDASGSVLGILGNTEGPYFQQFENPGSIQVADDVVYITQLNNPLIKVYSVYTAPVYTAPTEPQNVTVDTTTPETLVPTWETPVDDGGDPITEYLVEYKISTDTTWTTVTVTPPALTYTIDNLTEGTYDVQIIARNDYGDSPAAIVTNNVVTAEPVASGAGELAETGINILTYAIIGAASTAIAGVSLIRLRQRLERR